MSDTDSHRKKHQRLSELFTEARKLPQEQRPSFLEKSCADVDLRDEVLALLARDSDPVGTEFIQQGIDRAAAEVVEAFDAGAEGRHASDGNRLKIGDTVDSYRLIDILGEGGFGVVYEAEQVEPVKRRVALKILKPGMNSVAVIARFNAERQALALMDHPSVAHVYDGGTTAAGLPYFVMERIDGEPITHYADRHRLDVRQRIELFIQVCGGVQHAHAKGVIHRDLKPSNLLVEHRNGGGRPKVIDFGIAKAISQPLTDATVFTRHGQLLGSVEFMSPEQADMVTADVDTRSDIYSLGVVLYELLCGLSPFESGLLRESGLNEVQRVIREVDPPRPSARLAALSAATDDVIATEFARDRDTDIDSLPRTLRRDLDWIVMKCLEKDRDRRYETVNALAADLRRFLANEPVLAGPPGLAYRSGKFIKRNRAAVAAGVVAVSALVIATIVSIDFAVRADREADAAETARLEVAQRAEELRQVADFQAEQLGSIDPTVMGMRLRQAILDAAPDERLEDIETSFTGLNFTDIALDALQANIFDESISAIDRQFSDQPAVHAQLLQTISDVMLTLGLLDAATDPQERALAIRREHLGDNHPDTISSVNSMGELLHLRGKLDEAELYFREALLASTQILGEDHPDTIRPIADLGALMRAKGELDEAESLLREALQKRLQVLGPEHPDTLVSMNNLGLLLRHRGNLEAAETYYQDALQIRRKVLGNEHRDTLTSINNLGALYWTKGNPDKAESYLREALETRRRVLGRDHPATLRSTSNLGVLLETQGKSDEAEPYYREALAARRRLLGAGHASTILSESNLGVLLRSQGRLDESVAQLRNSMETSRESLGPDHSHTLLAALALGVTYRDRGDYTDAIKLLTSIEKPMRETFKGGNAHRTASTLMILGQSRSSLAFSPERFLMAERNLNEAFELFMSSRGEQHKQTRECAQALADFYTLWHEAQPSDGHNQQAAMWSERQEAAE